MAFIFSLLCVLSYLLSLVSAYADPLPCSGICTNTHDPAIIRRKSDGKYFRFATGGGISVFSASSIQGPWASVGEVLPSGSSIDNSGADDAWAPDVKIVDGVYYCYYAVSSFGTQNSAIGVATSKTMEAGSWTDHGSIGLSSSDGDPYNTIDANLRQVNGKKYMTFGSFWGDIYQTTMSDDALSISGDVEPHQIEFNATGSQASEGAYVFKQQGYYYLFWSSGKCCGYDADRPAPGEEYKIMVCRSESVDGGYVDKNGRDCTDSGGTQVLGSHGTVYGPGGQGVFRDPKLGPVLYYHYVDTTVGFSDGDKQLGVNVIKWQDGWPTV